MSSNAVQHKSLLLLEGFILSRQVVDCTTRTLNDYKSRLKQFIKFLDSFYPTVTLDKVTRSHVEYYFVWLRENGRQPWTIRTTYRALKAFYNWMYDEDLIETSPFIKIKPPRVPKLGKPFLTEDQFKQLLYVCDQRIFTGSRTIAMLWLLWQSGMRFTELANLKLADLDGELERIKVFGKGRKERYVEYPPESRKAVWRYRQFRNDDLSGLWITEERRQMKPDGVKIAIIRTYERANIKIKDAFHIFRRTWAMNKIRKGYPIWDIMLLGGWEDPKTLDGYVRSYGSEQALIDIKNRRGLR